MNGQNAPIHLGTKAETLERLSSKLIKSVIPSFTYFTVGEWEKNSEDLLGKIKNLKAKSLVTRSSALCEDTENFSMAGAFCSILNVDGNNEEIIKNSVEEVIASYSKANLKRNGDEKNDHVLVQEMLLDIHTSGVIFTKDLNTGASYYVINYDDVPGRTDTVTSGSETSNRTLLVHKRNTERVRSQRFINLLEAVTEIEEITGLDSLDIEFVIDSNDKVYILQVRRIAAKNEWNPELERKVDIVINRCEEFFKKLLGNKRSVFGDYSLLGRMPDWNPAEMIGTHPRPLALSLYDYLITRYSWREARRRMGYQNTPGQALMVSLAGQPYIDVRASFNSFLPQGLPDELKNKLVTAWLDRLKDNKELHDKVEFDVAITAMTFSFEKEIERIIPGKLNQDEIKVFKENLTQLTNDFVLGNKGSIAEQDNLISELIERRKELVSRLEYPNVDTISSLLEDCIHFGTIPFSILARHGFVAKSLLNSLVDREVLTPEMANDFLNSFKTVAGEFVEDYEALAKKELSKDQFMEKYGHLRPGTYDILSARYDQRQNLFENISGLNTEAPEHKSFEFSLDVKKKIEDEIKRVGFTFTVDQLLNYIEQATVKREYAKFIFTKNLSDALEFIASWCERVGLDREEASYLSIHDILDTNVFARGSSLKENLKYISERNKGFFTISTTIHFPYLIEDVDDLHVVPLLLNNPNFITKKSIKAQVVVLSGREKEEKDLTGKVVCIEGADPGYDWIFSRNIGGLVTKYGGANSHMAIRCAEFGIPAAIGCGEQIFSQVSKSKAVELSCSEGRILCL